METWTLLVHTLPQLHFPQVKLKCFKIYKLTKGKQFNRMWGLLGPCPQAQIPGGACEVPESPVPPPRSSCNEI